MTKMNEAKAREVLGEWVDVQGELVWFKDGDANYACWLKDGDTNYVCWFKTDRTARLDGDFTAEELRAIAWWMENKGEK